MPAGSAADRVLHGWPGASPTVDRRERRLQGWETLMVLSVFPLGATFDAVLLMAEHLATGQPALGSRIEPNIGLWLPLILGILEAFLPLPAVFLVWYLLKRSGEGLKAINLGGGRLRTDLAFLLPLFLVVFVAPQWLGGGIMGWVDIHRFVIYGVPLPTEWAQVLSWGARGLQSGIVEELVVLGYLVRRLEQRGWPWGWVVVADVAVRVSYHVYYGPGVLPIALWATVSVLVYLRIRRLLPFILCHITYDVGLAIRTAYHDLYIVLAAAVFVLGLAFTARWSRWAPVARPADALLTTGPKGRSVSAPEPGQHLGVGGVVHPVRDVEAEPVDEVAVPLLDPGPDVAG